MNTSARRYTTWKQKWNNCLTVLILWDSEILKERLFWYLHSKTHCLTLDLLCTAVFGTIIVLGLFLPWHYFTFSICWVLSVCIFLCVNKTKSLQFKDIHPSEQSYKHFVTKLIYFWNKKTNNLEMSSFLNTVKANLSNFQQSK